MKLLIYFFFSFFFLFQNLLGFELSIRFFNRTKQTPEANIQVLIRETKKIYQTNQNGYIQAEFPSNGKYTFRLIKLTGFEDFVKRINQNQKSILVYTDKKKIGGINVLGKKKKTVVSRHKVRYDEIKRLPGSFGEALRGIDTLPGINPEGGFSDTGDPVIRGAEPTSNIYLYDGLPIYYAFHWDGFNSVINNDLIKSIDVYTGVYPSKFDNVTGGVIEIESTERPKKDSGVLNIGLWSSSVSYRKSFEKFYIGVGLKKGYLDKTIGPIFEVSNRNTDKIKLPEFSSSQVKIAYELAPNHLLTFTNLSAVDTFLFISKFTVQSFLMDPLDDSAFRGTRVSNSRGFNTAAIKYDWTPSSKMNNSLKVINYVPYDIIFANLGYVPYNSKTSTGYNSIQDDLNWKIFSFLTIETGFDYRILNYRLTGVTPVLVDPDNENPDPYKISDPDYAVLQVDENRKEMFSKSYSTLNFKVGNFNFQPGVRYNYFSYSKQSSISPRANVSYLFPKVGKGLTLFSSAGKMAGFPTDALTKLSNEDGNPDLKFEKVKKYGAGFEQRITTNTLVKIEAFRNDFYDLIVSDPYISDYISINPSKYELHKYPLVYNKGRYFSNKGTGDSKGYELLIRKNSNPLKANDWFGWISYTLSKTVRNEHTYRRYKGEIYDRVAAEEFKKDYVWSGLERLIIGNFVDNSVEELHHRDRTHIINLIYGLKIRRVWQFGARWTYLTQPPFKRIIGSEITFKNKFNDQYQFRPVYVEDPFYPNEWAVKRMKPYHKLDLRIDRFYHYEWGYMNYYFSVLNVYLRKNLEPDEGFDSRFPYSPGNPTSDIAMFNYINQYIPFLQIGLEVRF